ncbi:MAG: RNA polymerase sigma factor [Nannocystaceae bacterium]|nr:RNA polymerase sigma factor [Nannocystaceae bacterium]
MTPSASEDAGARRRADVALAQRVVQGDAQAQALLLTQILPQLRAVARAILSNRADVDDAVQVALIRVLKGLATFRGDSTLVRWSRRVATHACLRLRQDNQRRLSVVELSAEPAEREAAPATENDGLPPEITVYLDRLPEKQREALVLRHVLGHSVIEVATLVGVPVDTVKSRLLYARRAMRAMIRREATLSPRRVGVGT